MGRERVDLISDSYHLPFSTWESVPLFRCPHRLDHRDSRISMTRLRTKCVKRYVDIEQALTKDICLFLSGSCTLGNSQKKTPRVAVV